MATKLLNDLYTSQAVPLPCMWNTSWHGAKETLQGKGGMGKGGDELFISEASLPSRRIPVFKFEFKLDLPE